MPVIATHIQLRSPTPQGWIQTSAVLRDTETGAYLNKNNGLPFTDEDVALEVELGGLMPLPAPVEIAEGQCFWITSESNIYLADKKRPDPNHVRHIADQPPIRDTTPESEHANYVREQEIRKRYRMEQQARNGGVQER